MDLPARHTYVNRRRRNSSQYHRPQGVGNSMGANNAAQRRDTGGKFTRKRGGDDLESFGDAAMEIGVG